MQYTNIEGNLDEIQNFINALDDYCDSLDKHTKSIQRKNDEVLTNWKGILAHVKNNWDIVNQYNEMQCYELLEQKIDEFLEGYEPNFDIADVIYKIATELGIVSKMEKHIPHRKNH